VALGSASWLTVNAVFAELPILAASAPEGWGLGAQLGFAIQLSNVFALGYLMMRSWCVRSLAAKAAARAARAVDHSGLFDSLVAPADPDDARDAKLGSVAEPAHDAFAPGREDALRLFFESRASLAVTGATVMTAMALGIVATTLLAFTWHVRSTVAGESRSLPLLVLAFVAGAVDCVSTVTFWPFASLFSAEMTTALAIGEGLSGVIPGTLALAQTVEASSGGAASGLTPTGFLLTMVAVLVLAAASFVGLLLAARAQPLGGGRVTAAVGDSEGSGGRAGGTASGESSAPGAERGAAVPLPLLPAPRPGLAGAELEDDGGSANAGPGGVTGAGGASGRWTRVLLGQFELLALLLLLSFVQNGAITAILPYASAPLDPRSPGADPWAAPTSTSPGIVYRWANTVGLLLDPVGAALTLWPRFAAPSRWGTVLLLLGWIVPFMVIGAFAMAGPRASWGGSRAAAACMVAGYGVARFCMGLQRARLFLVARMGGFRAIAARSEHREDGGEDDDEAERVAGERDAADRPGPGRAGRRKQLARAVSGERVTLMAGTAVQLGACFGSLLLAVLVEATNIFHQTEDAGL